MDKKDEILKWSNPSEVRTKALKYFGDDVPIYLSTKKTKKYMVKNPINNKWIHFGQIGFEDYTKHKDKMRRLVYKSRATKIKGDWLSDPYSANNLSINLLW
jgi:hypothetical protein